MITSDVSNLSPDIRRCDIDLGKYILSDEMMHALSNGKDSLFIRLRRQALVAMIEEKLMSCGIEVSGHDELSIQAEERGTDIKSFLFDFDDLNNAERREVCEVLERKGHYTSPVFVVTQNTDDSFLIRYSSFNTEYYFTETTASQVVEIVKEKYCNGETPSAYFGWPEAVEKDD